MLRCRVSTSNGFVAQIFLRLCFTSSQTDSAYGNGTEYAKSYEAVEATIADALYFDVSEDDAKNLAQKMAILLQ